MTLNVVEELARRLGSIKGVRLAYLYGSWAWGRPSPASDVDVAVAVDSPSLIPHVAAEVARALGVPEEKVSVLDLASAPPSLKLRIMARGVKLVDREPLTLPEDSEEVLEVKEAEAAAFRSWVKGNPVDVEVVRRIASQVEEDVDYLARLTGRATAKQVAEDEDLRRALERAVHTAIEGMVDLLRHIVASFNLGVTEYYRDYVEIARSKGVISRGLADRLLALIALRYRLVHRYRGLNHEELYREASKLKETWLSLVREVKEYLRKQGSPAALSP